MTAIYLASRWLCDIVWSHRSSLETYPSMLTPREGRCMYVPTNRLKSQGTRNGFGSWLWRLGVPMTLCCLHCHSLTSLGQLEGYEGLHMAVNLRYSYGYSHTRIFAYSLLKLHEGFAKKPKRHYEDALRPHVSVKTRHWWETVSKWVASLLAKEREMENMCWPRMWNDRYAPLSSLMQRIIRISMLEPKAVSLCYGQAAE